MAGAYLLLLNGFVRAHGGASSWISVAHLGDKQAAAAYWLHHQVRAAFAVPSLPPGRAVRRAASKNGVPPNLALAMARAESSLKPDRVSATGAMGLMQLMPSTARAMGVRDPFDAMDNALGGTRYLAQLLRRYGRDTRRAVAAYNAGPGRVPRRGPLKLPRETRLYLNTVLATR